MNLPSPNRTAILVLVAGFLVLFIGGGGRMAIGLTMKPMVDGFGWTRGDLGLAVGLFQVVSAVFLVVAGKLADRASVRLVLAGGLAAGGLGLILMPAVSQPWHVLVLFGIIFAIGNGMASLTPVGVAVMRSIPSRTGLANAVVISGGSVGQLVTIAGLAAVMVESGWEPVYVWLGAAHFALIPVVFAAIPHIPPAAPQSAARPVADSTPRQAMRTRQFWLLCTVYGICGFDDFFVATHIVALAQDKGLNPLIAGNLLALMGLTALVGVVGAGAWGDRSGPIWPTAVSFAARLVVFALVMVDQSPISIAIFVVVFGVTFMVTAPVAVLFVRDSFGAQHLGTITGVITMVHHIGGGVGAYFGAIVFDVTGRYDGAFVTMTVLTIVALILTLFLKREEAGALTAGEPHARARHDRAET